MADNLTQVLSNYIIYVDSSSFMHGNMEFFKISLFNVLKSTKRQIKVVDFVVKELKRKQFSDSEKHAVKALNIIDFYRKHGLVEDVVTSGIEDGKILDVIYNNRNVDKDDVCVITENKEVAHEIVTNLSMGKSVDFDYKIAAVRLINGPALWNIKTVKPKVMPINNKQNQPSQGVSFDVNEPTFETPKMESRGVSFDAPKATSFDTPEIEEVKIDSIPEIDPVQEDRTYQTPSYEREEYKRTEYKDTSYGAPSYGRSTRRETVSPRRATHETPRREPVQQRPTQTREVPVQRTAPTPKPQESFRPVNNSRQKRSRLVVSMVVDNSSSLNEQRTTKLKRALTNFNNKLKAANIDADLDLAIYGFDGFSPRVIKGFDGAYEENRFDNGGIQVLGKTVEMAMDDLVARQKLYKEHGIETHKPWLIILSDGGAHGDMTEQVTKLKTVIKGKKITYFPFSLSSMPLDQSLEPLAKLKMFLKIRDDLFEELFDFLYNTIYQRVTTPDEVHMTLDRKALAGFIAR